MKPIFFLIPVALFFAACSAEQNGQGQEGQDQATNQGETEESDGIDLSGRNADFLAKLTSSMSAEDSEPGDPVTGVLIDPEPLRGGRVEGTITRADRSFLTFHFHTLHYEGETYKIDSVVRSMTSSKGIAGQDDLGQRVRNSGGGFIAYGTTTAIDEGAEIRFVAWEAE